MSDTKTVLLSEMMHAAEKSDEWHFPMSWTDKVAELEITLAASQERVRELVEGRALAEALVLSHEGHIATLEKQMRELEGKLILMTAERDAVWSELHGLLGQFDNTDA
ncbi:MAG TPA: hypothetical protein VJK02_21235 [Anaerolineales bacterium]|nr:hypothetical protein [Anaerolineales bacterium]